MPPVVNLSITRGKTFEFGLLYADDEPSQMLITGMPSQVPLRLTVPGHGLPDGWPFWVSCVKSPTELNSAVESDDASEVMGADPYYVKVVDADTIEVPGVIAACWKSFSGPGVLVTRRPTDITGWHFRAQVRDKVDGLVLHSWHSDPAENPDSPAIVDAALGQFVLTMSAATSEALPWKKGLYDAEAIAPGGKIYPVTAISAVSVGDEITKP